MALLPMLRPAVEYPARYRAPNFSPAGVAIGKSWTGPNNPASYSVDSGSYGIAQLAAAPPNFLGAIANPIRWGKSRGILSASVPFPVSALAPTVASTAPNNGPAAGGTVSIVTGTNFIGASAVKFGGVSVTAFVVLSATQIRVVTQPHAAGAVDVAVTTPTGGTGTGLGVYTYT